MAPAAAEREPITLAESQRTEAAAAAKALTAVMQEHAGPAKMTVALDNKEEVTVPLPVLGLLADILREMGRGHAVLVVPYGAELTTQQAADLLNVSRPYVVKLIESGQLPARKVGPRRRVRFEDLMTFKQADDAHRREVARQLTAEAEEMGLGYVMPAGERD